MERALDCEIERPEECCDFLRAAIEMGPPASFAVLATVRAGDAQARMVVLRGVQGATVWFSTHACARKVKDIAANPNAQICLWLAQRRVQLVLAVRCAVIGEPAAARSPASDTFRKNAWAHHSVVAREIFFEPPPGDGTFDGDYAAPHDAGPDRAGIPDAFAVVCADIVTIEALDVSGKKPRRFLHASVAGGWTSRETAP